MFPPLYLLHTNKIQEAFTVTITNSGLQREFWMDLMASSAVNLPISRASLRLEVIWIGLRPMLCTY